MTKKNPVAANSSNWAGTSEIQQSEVKPPNRAVQVISRKFGLPVERAAVIARLAGLGPRSEVGA